MDVVVILINKENPMIQRFHKTGVAVAVTLGLAMLAPAAFAHAAPANRSPQAPTSSGAAASQSSTGPTPSKAELKDYAHAALKVQNIKQAMQPKLASANTSDARTKIKQAAEKKMEAVVRRYHLSIQRYVQIADAVNQSSKLRAEVQQFMPPLPPESSGPSKL